MNAAQTLAESRAAIRAVMREWDAMPALLCDRHFTVVESNTVARNLSPGFAVGMNLVRFTFLEADVDRSHAMYDVAADQVATLLRESLDQHEGDSTFRSIVGELSAKSQAFSTVWADDTLSAKSRDFIVFDDTPVGSIRLYYQVLRVAGNTEDSLIVWNAADEESRQLLARLTAAPSAESER
jgi:hypothetical protein